ncbi:unnamed protein product [Mytilus coruscus]|uniref:Uncharacterized protein n=1 Tax=Mytilus coruscus TaxID=42192 RepID=A0A6J8BSZ3_MYTCO|nr:unnamed protein product [Mytilus coruscus]
MHCERYGQLIKNQGKSNDENGGKVGSIKINKLMQHEIHGVNEELLSQCSNKLSENSTDISSILEYSKKKNVTSKHRTSYTTATNQHFSTNGVNLNEISTTQSGLLTGEIKSPKKYFTTNSLTLKNNEVSERFPATTEHTNSNLGIQSTTTHTINPNHDVYVSKPLTSTDIEQSGHFITTDIITFHE